MSLFDSVFEALDRSGTRYVVVGGVAVVLHGHARLTADLDIVVDLETPALKAALEELTRAGLSPRLPVDPMDFADPEIRKEWVEGRGMQVFTLRDSQDAMLEVDVFADSPIDFELLWNRSEVFEISGRSVHVAAISDLIQLKEIAGRPEDLLDIDALREITREREAGG